ncbi:hypothetical protein FRB97_000973 [Tulasnella sp. 331]|nr:hypothetical protein FRB97_000973 [Tulasnella sp. 331]
MASAVKGLSSEAADLPRLPKLEDVDTRPPFILTYPELKLLGIAGVGFFLDAYDLFIINPVSTMLQYRLYGGHAPPPGLQGLLKAGANIGAVIGQFTFGYLADALGRKAIYGKELMLIIFATIMSLTVPTGVGGDYPMSASVSSDRSNLRKRGTMLAYIFANQGWGSLMGSVVFLIVLLCYKVPMNDHGETSKVDGVWRIVIGVSLVPAFGTLYQRLTLQESTRFTEAQRVANESNLELKVKDGESRVEKRVEPTHNKAQFAEFIHYFSEWRHAKVLIGTCMCWFLLDIAFYGVNLNQNVVLQEMGFDGKSGSTPWEKLYKLGIGSLIVTALGFVPGYYATVLAVEYVGRKKIQLMGFLMEALFLGILAAKFYTLNKVAFIVNFALLQFFFNFGANTYAPGFTLLLPEVRGRDPDVVYEEELARARQGLN